LAHVFYVPCSCLLFKAENTMHILL
jgi:hypothetical protein